MIKPLIVEIINESHRGEWDAYLDKNDLAIAWQRWEWHDILKKHYPHDYYPLAAARDGRICGVFPLYRLHDASARNKLISVPFAVAGGIVSDSPEIEKALLEHSKALAKEKLTDSIILKQYKHAIAGDLRTDDTFFNRELALSQNSDGMWDDLDPTNRSMVSRAESKDFQLEYPSADLKGFYDALLSYHHRQGVPCASRSWIEDLVSSSMYSCAVVRSHKKIISGTLVKTFKKTVSFPYTAQGKNDAASEQASYWLYWKLILLFAEKGFKIMHSGRIPSDESVPVFRLGWGGQKLPYFYQYFPPTQNFTEVKRKRGLKRRLFSIMWRLLPKKTTGILGPQIVRKFP